ncbi:MAG: hypothetical protein KGP10_09275, partial [Actinomycetales bacterium]|nr:hypothetical protein [Actinomycetales bacterium]
MAPEPFSAAPDLTGAEAQFGPNAWLVAEMRERYQADPTSVDHRWAEYFAALPEGATHPSPPTAPTLTAPTPTAPTPTA